MADGYGAQRAWDPATEAAALSCPAFQDSPGAHVTYQAVLTEYDDTGEIIHETFVFPTGLIVSTPRLEGMKCLGDHVWVCPEEVPLAVERLRSRAESLTSATMDSA